MDRRRNKKHSNWNNQRSNQQNKNPNQNTNQSQNQDNKKKSFQFNHTIYQNEDLRREKQKAIEEIKARQIICPKCNQPIAEISSALTDRATGTPVCFECALHEIEAAEKPGEKEKIVYIGQGRFGLLYFENPRDQRKFTIKKVIEWEDRDKKSEWREELSGLYSKID